VFPFPWPLLADPASLTLPMSTYTATVSWERSGQAFTDRKYSRAHQWSFDGGAVVPASASPHVVRVPLSDPGGVDPEEAFVASLSSCHMLWFLAMAAQQGFLIDSYRDEALGELGRNAEGREAMIRVVLRPQVVYAGARRPTPAEIGAMHDQAHARCYIANSVRTEIRIEPD
jgi:organic hydroperoxide reductase OsmC/OhrA